MVIKKKEIKQIVESYKRDGYVNIFILGSEGMGKTTFGTQLLSKICKELNIEKNIDMLYYDYTKFSKSNFKVRYFLDSLFQVGLFNLSFALDNLQGKINIFEIMSDRDLNNFGMDYYKFELPYRGRYTFENTLGKFKNVNIFNEKDLYFKRKNELEKNEFFKSFTKLRAERLTRIMSTPNFNNGDSIIKFNLREGIGKSAYVKSQHGKFKKMENNKELKFTGIEKKVEAMLLRDNIDKRFSPPKKYVKKAFELLSLLMIYAILGSILINLVGIFSRELAIITYAIYIIISWEVFFKPLYKILFK